MKKFLFLLALVLHGTCSAQWTQILPTTVGTFTYYDMSVIAGADGNDTIFVCGTAGAGKPRIYRSFNGGTTWTSLPFFNYNPHSLSELYSVVAWRSGVVLVSGNNINGAWTYRSTDFGQTWNDAETKYGIMAGGGKWGPDGAYTHANSLSNQFGFSKDQGISYTFFNNTLGQVEGYAPYLTDSIVYRRKNDRCINKTTNQGQSWQQLICDVGPIGSYILNGYFFSPDTGIWCAGSKLIRTNDGGTTWDSVPVSGSIIHFLDRNKGMVWGGTQVSFSDNGGLTWNLDPDTLPLGAKESVYRSQNSAYALRSNILYKKTLLSSNDFIKENKINIFPNPSSKIIYFQGFKSDEMVEVFDFNGKMVLSEKIKNELNHDLLPGTYKILIKNKEKKILTSQTIIVQ